MPTKSGWSYRYPFRKRAALRNKRFKPDASKPWFILGLPLGSCLTVHCDPQYKVLTVQEVFEFLNLGTAGLVKPAYIFYRKLSLRIVTTANVPLLKQLPPMFWLIKYIQGFWGFYKAR